MDELKLQPRHSEDEEASSSSPSTEKFRSLTKRELYIAVLAALIGFTFGVSTFALSFGRRVSLSLEDWEIQHIHTMDDLRDRLELVTREKKECLEDDTQGLELAELRGKLTARSTLMRRVEELIEETRLREQEYFELQDTIERQTTEMEMSSKAKDQLTERMGRLSQQRSELTRQLKGLNRQVHELTTQVDDYQVQTTRYQDRIRQRESFLCKEVYGMGPYYVQITAKTRGGVDDDSAVSFVVELASRRDMSHSVFTFLSLVSYEMYMGTTFVVQQESADSGVVGLSMTMDAEVAFNERRRTVGMEESILMFPEVSSRFPCEEHSVGFQGMGPLLEFYLASPGESNDGRSCFGKIVRGVEKLQSIQESVSNGAAMDITHMQHLLL